jgi:hypothetical protein
LRKALVQEPINQGSQGCIRQHQENLLQFDNKNRDIRSNADRAEQE